MAMRKITPADLNMLLKVQQVTFKWKLLLLLLDTHWATWLGRVALKHARARTSAACGATRGDRRTRFLESRHSHTQTTTVCGKGAAVDAPHHHQTHRQTFWEPRDEWQVKSGDWGEAERRQSANSAVLKFMRWREVWLWDSKGRVTLLFKGHNNPSIPFIHFL